MYLLKNKTHLWYKLYLKQKLILQMRIVIYYSLFYRFVITDVCFSLRYVDSKSDK